MALCVELALVVIPFLLFVLTIGSGIVGIIGSVKYVSDKHDESVYKPTMCFVKNYTLTEITCSGEDCSSSGSQSCTTHYYSCNIELYTVLYNVSNNGAIQTTTDASNGPGSSSVSEGIKQCGRLRKLLYRIF
jgi:hypothetical protein